ncbi:MAG: type transport system permease protein [Thermosediminibacterales bacterium]|nr:type transport system permease protein [Thermosediminibacterales bacterium]MDK2835623.1 type transport system permease protein [Thermosediminibacterales bacterium]
MLYNFIETVREEWNLALKQKMIIIVIFVIPLLTNILLGFELSQNQIKNIPMAVFDQDNSSLSRMIVQQFVENETFDVKYYPGSSIEMEKLFNKSLVRTGMIIPKGFGKDVVELKSPTILMIYDGSHMPVTSAAKSRASEILLTLKTGILIKLLKAKLNVPDYVAENMAQAVKFSSRTLYNPTRSFKNFLNPGLGAAIVQSGIALMAAAAIRRESEREKLKRAGYVAGKVIFYGMLGTISLVVSILIQSMLFGIPFRSNMTDAVILSACLGVSVAAAGILISSLVKDSRIATVIAAVIFVPSTVMAGYTWPVMAMPGPYQTAANFLPFYHYADNLRDIYLKGLSIKYLYDDVLWFCLFTLTAAAIAVFSLKIEHKLKDKPTVRAGEHDVSG